MTPPPGTSATKPPARVLLYPELLYILLFIGIFAATMTGVVAFGDLSRWFGHAVAAGTGLVLLVLVIITGAIQSGRIRVLSGRKVFGVHKIAATCFSGIVIGTFSLGLLIMVMHGEQVLETPHGTLGLIVAVLCGIQLILSLPPSRSPSTRKVHRIAGYLIVPLFLVQFFLGLGAAHLFGLDL